ncbi:MAG: peptidase [Actinomycetia bacterium]|nr:peptidase [Actinomycetes bacterium]
MNLVHQTSPRPYFPEHGDPAFRVERYDLTLDYRIGPNRLAGIARLSAVTNEPVGRIALDFGAFKVTAVLVDGAPAHYTHRQDKLRVVLPGAPLPAETGFAVEVHYTGNPRPVHSRWGGLGWEQLTDGSLVTSQPIGAPSWFPCNDRPSDKAVYRISVTTASPYEVIANGELIDRSHAASTTTWVYEQAEPMASYLATVQIGRYRRSGTVAPVPLNLVFPSRIADQVQHDFARQEQMLAVFTRLFGPYPFTAYTAVVVGDELEIPVEAQGISVFGTNHVDGARGSERLVAHELAHQWFGNSLTLATWRDIWLHEGFAAYAEWLWSEAAGEGAAGDHALRSHRRLAALPQDFALADPGVRRLFDDRVYKRGALTLHALRCRLGDQSFFALLHEWTAAHRHGSVRTEDFVRLSSRYSPEPLEGFFSPWLCGPALPSADQIGTTSTRVSW